MAPAAAVAIISFAMMAAQAISANMQAKQQAKMAEQTAAQNKDLAIEEATRQQTEVNRVAGEDKSDRARIADRELATLRVMSGETGGATTTYQRMIQELGFFEGMDISRIEGNRKSKVDALQDDKKGAILHYEQVKAQSKAAKRNANIGLVLGVGMAGAQAGSQYYQQKRYEDILSKRDGERLPTVRQSRWIE